MRQFHEVVPGLLRLSLQPWDAYNVYLMRDVLVDSGGRLAGRKLFAALAGRRLVAHVLTHGHFDHQGSSHAVCERFKIPLMCGEGERAAIESGDLARLLPHPESWQARLMNWLAGPGHPVARSLREGDELGGFTVVEAPGHTPGSVAFWRQADRVAIIGDMLFSRDPMTFRRGLREPYRFATFDAGRSRQALRRILALQPAVVCFGHGAPVAGDAVAEFVSGLG